MFNLLFLAFQVETMQAYSLVNEHNFFQKWNKKLLPHENLDLGSLEDQIENKKKFRKIRPKVSGKS